MKLLISTLSLITLFAFTQNDRFKEVRFLEGTWKMEKKQDYETWKVSGDTAFFGSSYTVKGKKYSYSEHLSMTEVNGEIVYTATVLNQNGGKPVAFTLNRNVKDKVSFENLTHDFPKKIQYTKIDANTIFVEVLGDNGKGFSYKMMKQQ